MAADSAAWLAALMVALMVAWSVEKTELRKGMKMELWKAAKWVASMAA